VHASNPSEVLSSFCEHLRRRGAETRSLDTASAPALVARFSRALLRQCPGDAELAAAVRLLAERGFSLPAPPPEDLPLDNAGAIYARWPAADRSAVASATIALPSFQSDPRKVRSLFELFVRTPAELSRARLLLDALPADTEDAPLLRFRLALAEHRSSGTRPDWGKLLQPLRRLPDPGGLHVALRLASSFEIQQMEPGRLPLGLDWLTPLAEGAAVANLALALMRRPALGEEAPRIVDWLIEAGQPDWLAAADDADRRGDFATGTRLLTEALASHALPREAETAIAARARLLEDPTGGLRGAHATFAIPTITRAAPPRNGWNNILTEILGRDPVAVEAADEAAIAEAVGDRRVVAEYRLGTKDLAAVLDARLLGRTRVLAELALSAPLDESAIAGASAEAIACHALIEPGLERNLLALRLLGAGIQPLSLHDGGDGDDSEDEPTPTAPAEPTEGDDHHAPEQRVAAARILMDSDQFDAAAAIAGSLLRKVDRAAGSSGLYPLIADLLALDEPPEELVAQIKRALDDDKRNEALLTLFGKRPLAAYGLHEDLYDFAIDPSRPDAKRLLSLTAWLGIWRATETAPDAWGLRRIRETSEALVCVAAACLSGGPSPLGTAAAFMATSHDLEDEPFADALLSLSLDRA